LHESPQICFISLKSLLLGQYYNISLKDKDRFDGDIVSTVAITFHDESHRVSATDYWKFWLTQQKDSEEARAVELGLYIFYIGPFYLINHLKI
jgi:hypothetical protein